MSHSDQSGAKPAGESRTPVKGQTYRHYRGLRYQIIELATNATGYEQLGEVGRKMVVYRQLDEGTYPAGTIWVRTLEDFMGQIQINNKVIQIFSLEPASS